MKWFAKTGEWVEQTPEGWRTGLSAENVEDLGEVTFVELPARGQRLEQDARAGTLEAVKAATDFHTPVSGEVLAVNDLLLHTPSLLNSAPEGEGWLFLLGGVPASDLERLMTQDAWQSWLVHR